MAIDRLVIDTNLLISTAAHPTRTFAVWEAVRRGDFSLAITRAGLDEFTEVAARPRLQKALPELLGNTAIFLAELTKRAILFPEPQKRFSLAADPKDSLFFDLAIEAQAVAIVSLDKRHVLAVADVNHPQHQELAVLAPGLRLIHAKEFSLEVERLRRQPRRLPGRQNE